MMDRRAESAMGRRTAGFATGRAFDPAAFDRLQLASLGADGVTEFHLASGDEGGERWWVVGAPRGSEAAALLDREALIAWQLPAELAEQPKRLEHGDRVLLLYPHNEGTALADLPAGDVPLGRFIHVAASLARALGRLHGLSVAHGGLNPLHILVQEDGSVRFRRFGRAVAPQLDVPAGALHPISPAEIGYAAPEQARRDSPYTDVRSDLYTLGVVLYQCLVGRLPLFARGTAEWLHAHVAVEVARPSAVRADVPAALDALLLRLIAKDADQRYQSAEALFADLRLVETALAQTGHAEAFPLGRGEFAPKRLLSQRLFGRAAELADLGAAFERVRGSGETEIVFIAGEAGVGKSALVEQWAQGRSARGVPFAAGKSAILQKDVPYAPFTQALRAIVQQLLSEPAADLDEARRRLAASLAGYGRLLTDLVPEAAFVMGESPPLPEVPANLAARRIARVILQTCSAIASEGRPFILFLDDLQWLDEASLGVLRAFLEDAPPNLLFIGSYRVEEVASRPELAELLQMAHSGPMPVTAMKLGPLSEADAVEFVSSALNSTPADVGELARSVHGRTRGNAFYVSQLLRKLVEEKVIAFDPMERRWSWDRSRIVEHDTVADFMLHRLDTLAPGPREFLRRLACTGGRCPSRLFARILQRDAAEVEEVAAKLVKGGLLQGREGEYLLAHDRILEAAYALTPPAHRPGEHRDIALKMIAFHGEGNRDHAFDISTQIERSDRSALSVAERLSYVRVLRMAARRARNAGAVAQAAGYVGIARELLIPQWLVTHCALFFEVEWLYCDGLLAQARTEEALGALDELLALAIRPVDRADTLRLKAIAHTVQSAYEPAIEAACEGLALLGVELERSPDGDQLERAYRACRTRIHDMGVPQLSALPEASDPAVRSAQALLSTLISSFFVESGLRFLHVIKIVELTLEHGTTPESAYGLAWFGVFSAHHYGAYEDGAAYAMQAHALVGREGYEAQRTATLVALDQVVAWTRPLRFALELAREAARVGRAAGDLGMACYARNHIASDLLILGEPLRATRDEIEEGLDWTRQIQYRDIEHILDAQHALADTLISGNYDSARTVPEERITSVSTLFWSHDYAGITAFLFGDFDEAVRHLEKAMDLAWAAPAHIDTAACSLFFALAVARSSGTELQARLQQMAAVRARLADWARLNPTTFGCKQLLVEAEAARMAGDLAVAQSLYERSAAAAAAAGFVHEQALAFELAARCYRDAGLPRPVEAYVRAACRGYRQWGADGKAEHLLRSFDLAEDPGTGAPGEERQEDLDLAVMTKCAQTLAEEIGLEAVIRTLMRDMIVHAGAQSGLLMLLRENEPFIEASAHVWREEVAVTLHSAEPTAADLPLPVLNTVMRTHKAVVFSDAFAEAPRLRSEGPKDRVVRSLLCMPLMKRGVLVGILYLENNLAAEVFTPKRTAMLEILAPQAAISLDAARLYKDLLDENTRRVNAEFALREARAELARTSRMTAIEGYAVSIAHEINQPLASIVANADAAMRWLKRPQPDLGEALGGLGQIRVAGLRAAGIIKSLRALAKQTPISFVPVRLEHIVEDVLRLTSDDTQAQGIVVSASLSTQPGRVEADPVQIQQVVFNLITNAMHAMGETPMGQRRLLVETRRAGGRVHLAISDTGCGMSEEVMEDIFKPFFTTKSAGMGIGLAICRSVVEAHGGRLDVRSVVGRGSTFFLSLGLVE